MRIIVDAATGETTTVPLTEAEEAERAAYRATYLLKYLRNRRNELLAETDYFALSDVTMSDEMAAYRQALRDLPANTADPANPVWPEKPAS